MFASSFGFNLIQIWLSKFDARVFELLGAFTYRNTLLMLQDGSDIVCLGFDTLDTETVQVGKTVICISLTEYNCNFLKLSPF